MYDLKIDNKYHIDKNFLDCPKVYGDMLLYQVGRLYTKSGAVVNQHTHLDFVELTLVTDGRGAVITNGVSVPVSKGDIYVSFVGDFHEMISDKSEPLQYDFLTVQTKNPEMRAAVDAAVSKFHDPKSRIIKNENISPLLSGIIAELNVNAEYSDTIIEAMLKQVLSYVLRAFREQDYVKYPKKAGESEILCYQLMHYIDTHIFTMKHLSELCEMTNYNYNYLSNLYKKVTSDTLANYFRNRRLEAARLLLSENSMSVTRVASLLNYSSVYIFSRAFKEKYGISPSQVVPRTKRGERK